MTSVDILMKDIHVVAEIKRHDYKIYLIIGYVLFCVNRKMNSRSPFQENNLS